MKPLDTEPQRVKKIFTSLDDTIYKLHQGLPLFYPILVQGIVRLYFRFQAD